MEVKTYTTIFDRAKAAYGTGAYDDATLEFLFPELKVSEDERMINGLQGFLSAFGSDYFGTGGWQKFDDWLEKQKEQKPVENSGKELLYVSNKSYNIGYRDGKREAESKQEWSEEDEGYLKDALWCVEQASKVARDESDMGACFTAKWWLKSLRPSWKPSEEQMEALRIASTNEYVSNEYVSAEQFDILVSLYEQLKKL